jgi:excisionase family DNA binding protein
MAPDNTQPDATDEQSIRSTFMTARDLAAALDVSIENVYFHLRAGHIPYERVGRSYLIPMPVAEGIIAGYQRNKTWPTAPAAEETTDVQG